MSEPIIVAEAKVKDPKRVAAGKRLGAISKQRKEEKHLEREEQAQQNAEMEADNKHALYFIGGLVVVGVVYYSYLNKDKLIALTRSDKKKLPLTPPPKRKSKRIFDD